MKRIRCYLVSMAIAASTATTVLADRSGDPGTAPGAAHFGACCLPSGECIPDQSPEQCQDLGGEYQGNDVPCQPGTCPPPKGACCFDDGSCDQRAKERCEAAGGDFQGDGTLCENVECGGGTEGCTPGYWKQSQHFGNWAAPYTPQTPFADVFDDAFPGRTLLNVLAQGGGGLRALGRHTVAALLNAAGDVDYGLSVADVVTMFNDAFADGEYEGLKDFFESLNERGCPLGRAEGRAPEDLNADGRLDDADVMVLLGSWGACETCAADLTGDGYVGEADLRLMLASIVR